MRSFWVLLALAPTVAAAQMPLGDEFQVNTYMEDSQAGAAVGTDGAGGFVMAWTSYGSSGSDTSQGSIQAQRFAADGSPAGDEFQVNSWTTGTQTGAAVAPDGAGGFVVAWYSEGSYSDDDDFFSVQARRFSSDGSPRGDQFQVNSYTTRGEYFSAVGPDGADGFVVAWTSDGSDGGDSDALSVQAQRFSGDGSPQDGQFQVNTYTDSNQAYPAVGSDGADGFVIVWASEGSGGDDADDRSIQGHRFGSDGTPVGGEFQINTFTTGRQDRPDVAADGAGGFVVVWQSDGSSGDDADGRSIQARRFDADGLPVGAEFQVNAYTTSDQEHPVVLPDGLGGFVVSWHSDGSSGDDDSQESIQLRRFAADGTPSGPEMQVNTTTILDQRFPDLGPWGNDRFVVAWSSPNFFSDVYAQRYFSGLFTDGFESGDTSAWALTVP